MGAAWIDSSRYSVAIDQGGCAINHFADKLLQACRDKQAPICVGLDPVFERLPAELRAGLEDGADLDAQEVVERICRFATGVLDAVAPHVPCVKIQSACFERYLWPGVEAYHRIVSEAQDFGLLVVGDAKRGDIGISADHYAAGCLADSPLTGLGKLTGPDALTINSYFGADGVNPFINVGNAQAKGLFALVRTSNPGGDALQSLRLDDGRTVAEAMAQIVADLGAGAVGDSGYSLLGAVVGATKPAEAEALRKLMPQQIFLVPGFGAQGGGADDVKACFDDNGEGALITASRSVIYAFNDKPGEDWRKAIADAALDMKQQIAAILK